MTNSSEKENLDIDDVTNGNVEDSQFDDDSDTILDPDNSIDLEIGDGQDTDELTAQKERYLRLAAEYDNYRKRTSKEVVQASVRGQGDIIKKLLDSLDDLSRFTSVDASTTDAKTLLDGVSLIEKNIIKVLETAGVEVIDPVGETFDPSIHEALTTQPTDEDDKDNTVAQVYQRGYQMKDMLLRPARVVVFKS